MLHLTTVQIHAVFRLPYKEPLAKSKVPWILRYMTWLHVTLIRLHTYATRFSIKREHTEIAKFLSLQQVHAIKCAESLDTKIIHKIVKNDCRYNRVKNDRHII